MNDGSVSLEQQPLTVITFMREPFHSFPREITCHRNVTYNFLRRVRTFQARSNDLLAIRSTNLLHTSIEPHDKL